MQELQKAPLAQYANHLILLTDGHTYGDAEECLRLARQAAAQGIGISAFGIGAEWNDQFLDKLVAASGGRSGFIESPTQIIDYLQERIMGLGAVYAQNLRLSLDFPKSIALQDAFKLAPFSQPLASGTNELTLGDVENRLPVSFLLELTVAPQPMETRITIPLNFLVDVPGQQVRERTLKQQFQLLVLSQETSLEPPVALVKAVRMLNIYRMNEKVWDEVEAGQLDVATTRMRRLTTRLLEAGETKLAQQAHAELERLHTMGTLSLEGRKKLKYGTRALVTRSVSQDME
jgi:Ca-activated chloride channel family protein